MKRNSSGTIVKRCSSGLTEINLPRGSLRLAVLVAGRGRAGRQVSCYRPAAKRSVRNQSAFFSVGGQACRATAAILPTHLRKVNVLGQTAAGRFPVHWIPMEYDTGSQLDARFQGMLTRLTVSANKSTTIDVLGGFLP